MLSHTRADGSAAIHSRSVRGHLRERCACHSHLGLERDAERRTRCARSLEERFEVALGCVPLTGGVREMTENEAAVALSARRLRERSDDFLETVDLFVQRAAL